MKAVFGAVSSSALASHVQGLRMNRDGSSSVESAGSRNPSADLNHENDVHREEFFHQWNDLHGAQPSLNPEPEKTWQDLTREDPENVRPNKIMLTPTSLNSVTNFLHFFFQGQRF